jgi:MFS family permease
MFLFRLGVGVGEAGGVAPSHAVITEYFPPERRARAMSIYALGVPLGLAGGALLGGYLARDWRMAFIVAGMAGIIVAPVFKYVVRDLRVPAKPSAVRVPAFQVFRILARKPSFWLVSFAASMSSLVGYGLAFWVPSVLIRSFGFDVATASQYVGSLHLIGGTAGVLAGGWLADRWGARDRGAYAKLPAAAWLLTAPLYAAAFFSSSPTIAWLFFVIPHGLNILWLGPVYTIVQHLVPREMRATAAASFLLINNLIGLGLGSVVMGVMSDAMTARFGNDALRYSSVAALGFFLIAAVLMLCAVRTIRRDWVDE